MGENSRIEWTTHTFNPWRGCQKVSAGCANCYAETLSKRNPAVLGEWGPEGARVVASEAYWRQPMKWNLAAYRAGLRARVFCASLADVFEDRPELREPRLRLWELIYATGNLDWLLLTKRPENVMPSLGRLPGLEARLRASELLPRNVWIGTSVEDQAAADKRIPHLLRIPAVVRFLSCEPLLGPIDIGAVCDDGTQDALCQIDWVIAGGESGPHARPMHPDWARSLRDQCQAAGVPFFFKQFGEWAPRSHGFNCIKDRWGTHDGEVFHELATPWNGHDDDGVNGEAVLVRVGKKAAGRLLDGCEWNEFPGALSTETLGA